MKKTIKDNEIRNPKSRNELNDLFLYELFYEMELKTNPVEILIFFNKEYKYDLTVDDAERLSNDLKRRIERFRMMIAGNSLQARGYESEEF
jgi:hypothetical protein